MESQLRLKVAPLFSDRKRQIISEIPIVVPIRCRASPLKIFQSLILVPNDLPNLRDVRSVLRTNRNSPQRRMHLEKLKHRRVKNFCSNVKIILFLNP